jgi:hypothetical protein
MPGETMVERITGSFPGGPTRKDTTPQRSGPVRAAPLRTREDRRAAHTVDRSRLLRRRRVVGGFVLSLLLAGGLGLSLGLLSHTTVAEASGAARQQQSRDLDISQEVNRALLELWRMEEVEGRRGAGGLR